MPSAAALELNERLSSQRDGTRISAASSRMGTNVRFFGAVSMLVLSFDSPSSGSCS